MRKKKYCEVSGVPLSGSSQIGELNFKISIEYLDKTPAKGAGGSGGNGVTVKPGETVYVTLEDGKTRSYTGYGGGGMGSGKKSPTHIRYDEMVAKKDILFKSKRRKRTDLEIERLRGHLSLRAAYNQGVLKKLPHPKIFWDKKGHSLYDYALRVLKFGRWRALAELERQLNEAL